MTIPQVYLERSISTADPAHLVLALYDGALAAVDKAEECLVDGQAQLIEVAHRQLIKAQEILTELRVCLDHSKGGDIAHNLDLVYSFCIERLVGVNLSKDPADLDLVRRAIRELRDAWHQACCLGPVQHPQPAAVGTA
jgi:flagellar protein FliS